ncbi:AfsA-related hotdog domain-containing protein, partial [Streptomyces lonarensis]
MPRQAPPVAPTAEPAVRRVLTELEPGSPGGAPGPGPDGWTGRLRVDESDPFFYDHPLDHVPGMLLLEGMLRTAAHAADRAAPVGAPPTDGPYGPRHVAALELRLTRLCRPDPPARVEVAPDPGAGGAARYTVRVVQDGAEVCGGTVLLGGARAATAPGPGGGAARVPRPRPGRAADARLVHKWRPEAVLVGPLSRESDGFRADLLAPRDGHGAGVHPTTLLVECARQFATMAGHLVAEVPLDWQFLLTTITVATPAPT